MGSREVACVYSHLHWVKSHARLGEDGIGQTHLERPGEVAHMRRVSRNQRNLAFWILSMAGIGVLGTSLLTQNPLPYNILLVSAGQMGAECFHSYGYPAPDSPNIEKRAKGPSSSMLIPRVLGQFPPSGQSSRGIPSLKPNITFAERTS